MEELLSAPDWQREIYLNGFAGKKFSVKVSFEKLERKARKKMSREAFAYIAGGAGAEATLQANRNAFDQWQIVPRMLNDVSRRDTSIELFGQRLPAPLLFAPVGVLEMVHAKADIAVAKAAARLQLPYIFSNQASRPMEACAEVMGNSPKWFQLYWSKSNDLVLSFLQRAERCGCKALVVTLDTTLLGWRTRDLDVAYLPFLEGKGIAQYTSDPVFQKLLDEPDDSEPIKRKVTLQSVLGLISMVNNYPGNGFFSKLKSGKPLKAVRKFVSIYSNPATTWNDLSFLRQNTKLPIILKGIIHSDDARRALDAGMDGIIVSNHGGRQTDGSIATMDALPKIVEVVQNRIPVLLDSGVRGGADVVKALALGAKAVCVGRPYVYGLAAAGEQGVYEVMRNIMADFELTMALAGCKNIAEINREMLVRSAGL
ncbi:MAG TPA: lactate 2-monooxygenase [Cyclobacteriaceae bacterium]|nr:lactate 2-monooxygenase [Cyclobacteriaceae bacterium]HMV10310.1 lactate 2-monooxygenase [Cyclobacteriaceae bacterium]HMX50063.1 lactate 2-monooxygenase [Cyclobacteriaceae bacterium]HMY92492.1 lactate 2-monooxygenase [Cyclobacteriaceae bacterium]HNA14068.1 lactate 2-monooxygenase [Cyclobacteriaceae bacterium]